MKIKIFLITIILLIFTIPVFVMAQEFNPQVGIPGEGSSFKPGQNVEVAPDTFAKYIVEIYEWGIRIIIVLAVVMIMVGGFIWMTAGGSSQKVGSAKKKISSAIVGLILALGSYMVLNFINPELVSFRSLVLTDIEGEDINMTSQCDPYSGYFSHKTNIDHCFKLTDESGRVESFSLAQLGLNLNIKKEDIKEIEIDLGASKNYVEDCDKENDYGAMGEQVAVTLKRDDDENKDFFACIIDGQWCYFCSHFAVDLDNEYGGRTAIKVKAVFKDDNTLEGLKFKVADTSGSKGSAFFKDINIIMQEPCAVCCKKDGHSDFVPVDNCQSADLDLDSAPVKECCDRYNNLYGSCEEVNARTYNKPAICKGLSDLCTDNDITCKWDAVEKECVPDE